MSPPSKSSVFVWFYYLCFAEEEPEAGRGKVICTVRGGGSKMQIPAVWEQAVDAYCH